MKDSITRGQWEAYRLVQDSGLHNMLTPQALEMSGLDKDVYFCIIENYSKLKERFDEYDNQKEVS